MFSSPTSSLYWFTGLACFGITSPLIYTFFVGSEAFEVMVTVFWKRPGRPFGLYVTVIVPVWPGSTGSFVHVGVVQPQLARTLLKTNGAMPSFLKLNTTDTRPSASLILPKSCSVFSNVITACCPIIATANRDIMIVLKIFFISFCFNKYFNSLLPPLRGGLGWGFLYPSTLSRLTSLISSILRMAFSRSSSSLRSYT